jgi:hypothetical protein
MLPVLDMVENGSSSEIDFFNCDEEDVIDTPLLRKKCFEKFCKRCSNWHRISAIRRDDVRQCDIVLDSNYVHLMANKSHTKCRR